MDDLTHLQYALAITLVDLREHLASGDVPEHEVRRLVDLAERAQGYLWDFARSRSGL